MTRWLWILLCWWLILPALGCRGRHTGSSLEGDLLEGRSPVSRGVAHPERINDGVVSREGGHWKTRLAAVLADSRAEVVYDLGQPATIDSLLIQADSNDVYLIHGSLDGERYEPIWRAPKQGSGMQTRYASQLGHRARFLRVLAESGDGRFSIAELAAFSGPRTAFPPAFSVRSAWPAERAARVAATVCALAAIAFVLALTSRRRWTRWLGLAPLAAGALAVIQLAGVYPFSEEELTVIRALTALVALAVVVREWFSPESWPFDRRFTVPLLAALSMIAVSSYYHFGTPQFRDEAQDRPTLVHPWDMRVYFPVAKYFRELRYDGLYLASLAAFLDNNPGESHESIADVRLRSLRNNEMVKARQVVSEIEAVRGRFTPQRWEEFRRDMRYFQDVMGRGGYLGSLRDHGGNATPVWLFTAWLLFHRAPASELTLTLGGLLDPLLLLVLFVAIARTFGVRAMLVTLIAWGTTDFSRFGTNLAGSTLRADWMAALGLGVCALASRRWALGGALLAYSGLIRGFPALAALSLAGPPLWWLVERVRARRRLPTLHEVLAEQGNVLRVAAGGVAAVALLVAASSAAFSFRGSWGSWREKIQIHQDKPNVNHVGLRTLVSFEAEHVGRKVIDSRFDEPWVHWQKYQLAAYERRAPLFFMALLAFVLAVLLATRTLGLHQAALAGTLLIPVFFYPANYYCHYVFLLPLLGAFARKPTVAPGRPGEPRSPAWLAYSSVVVLAMCAAAYPTLAVRHSDEVFTQQSWLLLIGFGALILPFAFEGAGRLDVLLGVVGRNVDSFRAETVPASALESPAGKKRRGRRRRSAE